VDESEIAVIAENDCIAEPYHKRSEWCGGTL